MSAKQWLSIFLKNGIINKLDELRWKPEWETVSANSLSRTLNIWWTKWYETYSLFVYILKYYAIFNYYNRPNLPWNFSKSPAILHNQYLDSPVYSHVQYCIQTVSHPVLCYTTVWNNLCTWYELCGMERLALGSWNWKK